jgi:hypothetical protein
MRKEMDLEHRINMMKLSQMAFHQNNKSRFVVNRICSCCGVLITEKDVVFIGENSMGVWFNHKSCNATMIQVGDSSIEGPRVH